MDEIVAKVKLILTFQTDSLLGEFTAMDYMHLLSNAIIEKEISLGFCLQSDKNIRLMLALSSLETKIPALLQNSSIAPTPRVLAVCLVCLVRIGTCFVDSVSHDDDKYFAWSELTETLTQLRWDDLPLARVLRCIRQAEQPERRERGGEIWNDISIPILSRMEQSYFLDLVPTDQELQIYCDRRRHRRSTKQVEREN